MNEILVSYETRLLPGAVDLLENSSSDKREPSQVGSDRNICLLNLDESVLSSSQLVKIFQSYVCLDRSLRQPMDQM